MNDLNIQRVLDEKGTVTSVIVPINIWQEIQSEKETAYLLKSEVMKQRLLAAKNRREGIDFEVACEKLGI
ncbi:MAG TPA: prevent-host-death protein [Thiotrichaceae bacterium]|nr:prevent-host-death protein [Thiotrichaceae bacterium]